MAFHPDWADAINPLRVGLVERGYSTLSLQMPVLEKDAKYYDYDPIFGFAHARIEAGMRYLRDSGHRKVILLAHSCGVHMAMDWIGNRATTVSMPISASVWARRIMGNPCASRFRWQDAGCGARFVRCQDYPGVSGAVRPRVRRCSRPPGTRSRASRCLPQANHYFTDQGDALVAAVADWLDHLQ